MSSEKTTSSNGPQKLGDALTEAQNIVAAAEKRALELKAEAEQVYEEAYAKGYEEGFRRGEEEAVSTAVRMIKETATIRDSLSEEAAKLAIAICSQILSKQLEIEPKAVKEVALSALRSSVIGDSVTIVVHPADKEILLNSKDQLRRIAGGVDVAIDSDPSLSRGGCIVRTEFGEVDASIEALLDGIASRLGLKSE